MARTNIDHLLKKPVISNNIDIRPYMILANKIICRMMAGNPYYNSDETLHEDVFQYVIAEFIKALPRHTGANGASLETYAWRRMIGAVIDFVRKNSVVNSNGAKCLTENVDKYLEIDVADMRDEMDAKIAAKQYIDKLPADRNSQILRLALKGVHAKRIAERHGITNIRVYQILKKRMTAATAT